MTKEPTLTNKFIVENELEFWLLRKDKQEKRIKFFLEKGIKVRMFEGDVVDIMGLNGIDYGYRREIIGLAEEYCRTLEELKQLEGKSLVEKK